VGGSGRADLCGLTCDGGGVCATAMHCFISRVSMFFLNFFLFCEGGSVAEWLACWTQALKNRDQPRNPTLGNRVCETLTFIL